MTTTAAHPTFLATAGGGRKHIPQCPYLVGSDALPVPAASALDVCDWCERELSGYGRTYFEHLGAALDAYRVPVQNKALITQHLAGVEHDQVWMPYSASYVALGLGGRGVAWTGKTYVVPEPGVSVLLPGFVSAQRDGRRSTEARRGATCPLCHEERALNGACSC